jgi:hypothetical protein
MVRRVERLAWLNGAGMSMDVVYLSIGTLGTGLDR